MINEKIASVAVRAFGPGGAEMGMSRAEMYARIDNLEITIMTALQFEAQIIFGWLVAMFFAAHRLSRLQMLLACVFFLAVGLLNLAVIVSAITRAGYWMEMLYASSADDLEETASVLDVFLSVISNGPFQLALILSLYSACIWWAYSCRRNQKMEIGSPL